MFSVYSSQINQSGGIELTFDINKSSSQIVYNNGYPISYVTSFDLLNSSYMDNSIYFQLNLSSSSPSNTTIYVTQTQSNLGVSNCIGGNLTPGSNYICNFTYPDSWKSSITSPIFYVYTYNQNNSYSLMQQVKTFYFQRDEVQQYSGGLSLIYKILNISVSAVDYVLPTPEDNIKKYNLNNITIKINDGNYIFNSCKVEINNQNYTMNYSNRYCTYTYSFNSSNVTQTIVFQGFYNISGVETGIGQRTIYIYPSKTSNNKMPAYGVFSLILSFILIGGGFLGIGDGRWGRGDKEF